MTPPPSLVLLTRAVRGEKEMCVAQGPVPLPLYRSIGASGALLAARLPRCVLRLRLRAPSAALAPPREVTLAAGPPGAAALPGAVGPGSLPACRPGGVALRPTRADRQCASPCAPRLGPRPVAWQLLHLWAPGAAGGNETGMCPNPGGGAREGRARAGRQELFFQRQGCQPTARRRRLRPEVRGTAVPRAPPA